MAVLEPNALLLSKVVHKIVMGAMGTSLLYTFPLGEQHLRQVAPRA